MKNEYKFPKQITEWDVLDPPEKYEAYLYKFINLTDSCIYLGIHKGYVEDEYWHSSTNKAFQKVFCLPNSKFRFEVLEYGNFNYLTFKEYEMLSEVNAVKNPLYYNNSNGSPKYKAPNLDKCEALVKKILNKYFKVIQEDVEDHVNMERLQVRYEDSQTLQRDIKERIDDAAGSTEMCNPVIIYVGRKLVAGVLVDVRGDGSHTVIGIFKSKHGRWVPVIRIPASVHENFTDSELRTVGNLLNKKDDVVKKPIDNLDGQKYVEDLYYESGVPVDSKTHLADLKAFGFTKQRITTIIKASSERIKRDDIRTSGKIFINWAAEPYKSVLKSSVEFEKDRDTDCYSVSSATYNFVEQLANRCGEMMASSKTHLIIKLYHPTILASEEWDNQWGNHHRRIINSFFKNPTNPDTGEKHSFLIEIIPQKLYEKNSMEDEV